jgi:hypothetical protein
MTKGARGISHMGPLLLYMANTLSQYQFHPYSFSTVRDKTLQAVTRNVLKAA